MGDNSMYWSDQSAWYSQQHQTQQAQQPPPQPYQTGPYQQQPPPPQSVGHDHNQASPPLPPPSQQQPQHHHHHQQQPAPLPHPHPHQQQHHHHQQQTPPHSHPHPHPHQQPPPPSQLHHHNHHQQQQMMPTNGMSNGNHSMQSSIPNQMPQPPQQRPPQQQQQQMNHHHYNPHLNSIHQHESPMSAGPMQQQQQQPPPQQQLEPSSNYQLHHHQQQQAYPTPPQHQQAPPQPPAPMYAGQPTGSATNSYQQPNMMPAQQGVPSSLHPTMQQQQQPPQPAQQAQQTHYPQQQYSPPSYWNSTPMHSQSNYGPPSAPQGPPVQNVPTPPAANMLDNNTGYQQHANNAPSQAPTSMPYESRGPNMSANYASPYQQQSNPGYYSSHDVQAPNDPSMSSYDHTMSHQQQHQTNPQTWSNGYYQSSQSPYPPPSVMSSYPVPYNGSGPMSNPPNQPPGPIQSAVPPPPQSAPQPAQAPIYPHPQHIPPQHPQHHQPQLSQQSQQWPPQNHSMPIIERPKPGEKKPVKPRAPKKQSNPATVGRRKRPHMTEENKQSGYAKFFQLERKKLDKAINFADASTLISELWAGLNDEERLTYTNDANIKRKEMLKKKASQQAQGLLVQGMTQEPDVLIQGIKKE